LSTWSAPRALAAHEWPALRAAVNRVFRPAGGDLTHELPLLFDATKPDNLRVIVNDAGDIGAHAAFAQRPALVLGRRTVIGFIAAVFTEPAARGQRLGTRVLLDALTGARAGADLVLASGDRDLYRRQGFEPVPPLARFRLPSVGSAPTAPDLLTARAATEEDLPAVAALCDAEPVHFERTPDDWRKLLAAGRLVDSPATLSVIARADRVVAFVATQQAHPRPDGTLRPRRILEVAGDRAAIVGLAPLLADELLVPHYDTATIDQAVTLGWVRTARQFPITAEPITAVARVVPWYGLNYL
jgi:predicted N-acetyltransferase YhbS